jgi:hypothetical protein
MKLMHIEPSEHVVQCIKDVCEKVSAPNPLDGTVLHAILLVLVFLVPVALAYLPILQRLVTGERRKKPKK